MTDSEYAECIQPLFDAFPSLADFYERKRSTIRAYWVKTLAYVDKADADIVVERFVTGERDMPPNYEYDRMAIVVKREANEIRSKRNAASRMDKYLYEKDPNKCTDKDSRFFPAMREIIRVGDMRQKFGASRQLVKHFNAQVEDWYWGTRQELPESMRQPYEVLKKRFDDSVGVGSVLGIALNLASSSNSLSEARS